MDFFVGNLCNSAQPCATLCNSVQLKYQPLGLPLGILITETMKKNNLGHCSLLSAVACIAETLCAPQPSSAAKLRTYLLLMGQIPGLHKLSNLDSDRQPRKSHQLCQRHLAPNKARQTNTSGSAPTTIS